MLFYMQDIKNFKYVNEIFGYDVGDKLLKYWADGINKTIRDGEVFARFNVEQFGFHKKV